MWSCRVSPPLRGSEKDGDFCRREHTLSHRPWTPLEKLTGDGWSGDGLLSFFALVVNGGKRAGKARSCGQGEAKAAASASCRGLVRVDADGPPVKRCIASHCIAYHTITSSSHADAILEDKSRLKPSFYTLHPAIVRLYAGSRKRIHDSRSNMEHIYMPSMSSIVKTLTNSSAKNH